jgi:hypothetical protein
MEAEARQSAFSARGVPCYNIERWEPTSYEWHQSSIDFDRAMRCELTKICEGG